MIMGGVRLPIGDFDFEVGDFDFIRWWCVLVIVYPKGMLERTNPLTHA